jgi:FAD-dependent urate hydroxylase
MAQEGRVSSLEVKTSQRPLVAIIGAGPYGLSAAAHLASADVPTQVFGKPMEFWENNMPAGMQLRSAREASHIADQRRELTLDDYEAERGAPIPDPTPLDDFVAYGHWFQERSVPQVDSRRVEKIDRENGAFQLTLDDGDQVGADRVVLATGLARFPRRSAVFAGLSSDLVSHVSEHTHFRRFAGRRVIVLGGGQSALESAALLSEAGAEVEVLIRAPQVHWLVKGRLANRLGPARRILYPPTDVGPPGLNWLIALPDLFRRLPQEAQVPAARRAIRPAGANWLRPRLERVRLSVGKSVASAVASGDEVRLRLDDGTDRQVDHVMLATGYQIEIAGYTILDPRIRETLRTIRGYPALRTGFESSLPGLHFIGASAAESFGPLMRFVAGTGYTSRALTREVRSATAVFRRITRRPRAFAAEAPAGLERS